MASAQASSSSDDSDCEYDEVAGVGLREARPYMYEPEVDSVVTGTTKSTVSFTAGRANQALNNWCSCGHCSSMPTDAECQCCKEIKQVVHKCEELLPEVPTCILLHPGFEAVSLNPWVLQAAYSSYRQKYGDMDHHSLHMRYRYTSYRNFVRWCWGYLGKEVRVVLPACVVERIRDTFPSDTFTYRGFKLPKL